MQGYKIDNLMAFLYSTGIKGTSYKLVPAWVIGFTNYDNEININEAATKIFNNMSPALRNNLMIFAPSDLTPLISNPGSRLYDFIKVF